MMLAADGLLPVRHDGVQGDLRSWPDVVLPGLDRVAEIYAWLPPGYDAGDDRYPVLYLHDGHNVFLPERFPAAAAWLLRGYAVEPPPSVRQDLAERAAGGTAT